MPSFYMDDNSVYHLDFYEVGMEELYSELPEPEILQRDINAFMYMSEADEQALNEWLAQELDSIG